MQTPFLDATKRHPIRLPDGSDYTNTVFLKAVVDHPNIDVGDFTYFNCFDPVADYASKIAPYLHIGAPERLIIGKFCQIASGTTFVTSSADHPKRWFTTYPFGVFNHDVMEHFTEAFATGKDTIVGHDVWFGHNATILPGVTIGNGAIIGAGAVVAKDVPDYAVVAGNPATVVRMRFGPEEIDLLQQIAWWDKDIEVIRDLVPVLTTADVTELRKHATGL